MSSVEVGAGGFAALKEERGFEMRKDRLLKLADFLETVPRRVFNISDWQTSEAIKPEGEKPGECGFAGCAVGWAAHAKLFRGFKLADGWRPHPVYQGEVNWAAIGALFDISHSGVFGPNKEAEYLFLGSSYPAEKNNPTPKQVAKRIRQFVAGKSPSGV